MLTPAEQVAQTVKQIKGIVEELHKDRCLQLLQQPLVLMSIRSSDAMFTTAVWQLTATRVFWHMQLEV
jgi:hypothetical protein